jgi:hypothetical protein
MIKDRFPTAKMPWGEGEVGGSGEMPVKLVLRPVFGRALVIACLCAIVPAHAFAQGAGSSIVNGFLQAIQTAAVGNAWKKVDQQTQACLASSYNTNVSDLIGQGILPNDPRVAPMIQSCQSGPQPDQTEQASVAPQQNAEPARPPRDELIRDYGRRHADLILAGRIDNGMSENEVTLSWGAPASVESGTPGRLVWNYGNDVVVFRHGKVSEVHHQE